MYSEVLYTIVFFGTAVLLLFPLNIFVPLDRRLIGLFSSIFCVLIEFLTQYVHNPHLGAMNMTSSSIGFIDYYVLIILTSLMILNHILIQQSYVSQIIRCMQKLLHDNLSYGYYLICFLAFISSPFLMNDGLCLLLVDPVLDAFTQSTPPSLGHQPASSSSSSKDPCHFLMRWYHYFHDLFIGFSVNSISLTSSSSSKYSLAKTTSEDSVSKPARYKLIDDLQIKEDHTSQRFYLLLGLACSANIGSVMTYAGNPQNVIISEHLLHSPSTVMGDGSIKYSTILHGYEFFGFMFLPATIAWLITISVINYYRNLALSVSQPYDHQEGENLTSLSSDSHHHEGLEHHLDEAEAHEHRPVSAIAIHHLASHRKDDQVSVRERLEEEETAIISYVNQHKLISLIGFSLMIISQFITMIPLVAAYALIAITLPVAIILSNYYQLLYHRQSTIQGDDWKQRVSLDGYRMIIHRYIDELFSQIDYNLLLIFTGLFIVTGYFVRTNLPAYIW
jgi:Na+/H+ antiporter NhaD/arsenite permease-like protein